MLIFKLKKNLFYEQNGFYNGLNECKKTRIWPKDLVIKAGIREKDIPHEVWFFS